MMDDVAGRSESDKGVACGGMSVREARCSNTSAECALVTGSLEDPARDEKCYN